MDPLGRRFAVSLFVRLHDVKLTLGVIKPSVDEGNIEQIEDGDFVGEFKALDGIEADIDVDSRGEFG